MLGKTPQAKCRFLFPCEDVYKVQQTIVFLIFLKDKLSFLGEKIPSEFRMKNKVLNMGMIGSHLSLILKIHVAFLRAAIVLIWVSYRCFKQTDNADKSLLSPGNTHLS